MWYFAAPLCGTLSYNIRNLWHRRLRAPRHRLCSYAATRHLLSMPTYRYASPTSSADTMYGPRRYAAPTHLWAQCIDPLACITYPISGHNVSSPSHARSAYRNLACGETRVVGDATGRMTHLHNHAASRRRKTWAQVWYLAVPRCGTLLYNVRNLWHRRLRAPRHRLCSYAATRHPLSMPTCRYASPLPSMGTIAMRHLSHQWAQCIVPVAMRHLFHLWTQCIDPVACA